MHFLAKHGYSYRWKAEDRIVGSKSGEDPRVRRDLKERNRRHQILQSFQAIFCDCPWVLIGVTQGSYYVMSAAGVASVASGGFGFGMKFSNIVALIKEGIKKKVQLFTVCPAEIKIGAGFSYAENPEWAMEMAYNNAMAEIGDGREPSLVLAFMTANVQHEKALEKLTKITNGKVPFSGCTISMGAMMGTQCRQTDSMRLVATWIIHDPEGLYELGMADLSNESADNSLRKLAKQAVRNADTRRKKKSQENPNNPVIQGMPSFIWVNPPPGPEDEVLLGMQDYFGRSKVEIIGGSSADNDVSGSWKQWNSRVGVVTNGLVFVIAHCSAQVKGCAFTGYSATPKVGKVTKMNGARHILTIDHKPAGVVYDDWTSGHFKDLWGIEEDSVILAPSSVYPLGQIVSRDWDDEPVYRTLHPHLLVKKDKSVTVFSDVYEGTNLNCLLICLK